MKTESKIILVVEDEQIIAEDIRFTLKEFGYRVPEIASTGQEAIELAKSEHPDLILMDIMLDDDMSGVEAAKIIREQTDIPIIFLTAFADDSTLEKAKQSNPYGYLIKPFEKRELKAAAETTFYKIRMEKILKDSEERYRLLFNQARDAILIADGKGMIRDVNASFLNMSGFGEDELSEKPITSVLRNPQTQKIPETDDLKTLFATEAAELMIQSKGGKMIPVEMTIGRMTESASPDESTLYVMVMRDITARITAQRKLDSDMHRLSTIIQNMGRGIAVIDGNGKLLIVNQVLTDLLPLKKLPEAGSSSELLLEAVKNTADLKEAMEKITFSNLEIITRETPEKNLQVNGSTYTDTITEKPGKILIFRDFTHEKQEDSMRNRFVSRVSHEIRMPLTSILGYSKTILRNDGMPEDIRNEFMHIIQKESQRLTHLIDDVLNISLLEEEPVRYNMETFSASDILGKLEKIFNGIAKTKDIALIFEAPPSSEHGYGDPDAVVKAGGHLIQNAVKFTPESGVVRIRTAYRNKRWILEVQDNGIGIPREMQPRIFEKFYLLPAGENVMKGRGLGLYLVRRIMDAHNGDIELESRPGSGSVFTLSFPDGK